MTEAWDLAHAAARDAGVELRPLTTVDEADLVNEIIAAVWGGQRIDREVLRALAVSGNVPYGAFEGDDLIGFVLGWAGVDGDGLHVHSHMLAVVPERQSALEIVEQARFALVGVPIELTDPKRLHQKPIRAARAVKKIPDGLSAASTASCVNVAVS